MRSLNIGWRRTIINKEGYMEEIVYENMESSLFHINKKYNLETAWNHRTCLENDFVENLFKKIINNPGKDFINAFDNIEEMKKQCEVLSIELFHKSNKQMFEDYDGYIDAYNENNKEVCDTDSWGNNIPKDNKYKEFHLYWYGDPGCWRPQFFVNGECFDTYEDLNLLFRCSLAILELLSVIKSDIERFIKELTVNNE